HFSWRHANFSSYKLFTHQHLHEIGESLVGLQPSFDKAVTFVPYRGDFARGILATAYTRFDGSLDDATALYGGYYKDAAFTFVSDKAVSLKQVVNTNKCLVSLVKHGDKLVITSVIDNVVKGASGQAVQNMNIMFGLPQREGLELKPSAF
ncbi:MAG: N-acetyl-gamma-glutamyl-phosphate reductase, partial [Rikenellaceae bacterium]|nr:N-acetyl-gamma-glutamyl-phosphate reductase [Rikenellaceae bacterium]